MRIVSGTLRGRAIPSHRSLAGIRLTSARLKEAIFSMLGDDLTGHSFLDLCAGSGQVGLEALSRGAQVLLNEPDRCRCDRIRSLLGQWQVEGAETRCMTAQRLVAQLGAEDRRFDVVYVDPPYQAERGGRPLSLDLLEELGRVCPLEEQGLVLVQHRARLALPVQAGTLQLLQRRSYGSTELCIYRVGDGADQACP
ncbi:MAG: RsmD family RNA methyltransferase [Candidatus Latescibacterota bacterium]